MKIISGSSVDVGMQLSTIPYQGWTPHASVPFSSWFIYHVVNAARLSVPVPMSLYSPGSSLASDYKVLDVPGLLAYTGYSLDMDVKKFSHPIAAGLSYVNGISLAPEHRDKSVLHIHSDATLSGRAVPLYEEASGTIWGVPNVKVVVPTYASGGMFSWLTLDNLGEPLDTPTVYGWGYLGSLDLVDYFERLIDALETTTSKLYLIDGPDSPKVVEYAYWGSFYQLSVSKAEILRRDPLRGFTFAWTEWYANGYGQYVSADVVMAIDLVYNRRVEYGTSPHIYDCVVSVTSTSQSYQSYATGPIFGRLVVTSPAHADHHSVTVAPFNYPLTRVSDVADVVSLDYSSLFNDTKAALEKARVAVGYSTAKLNKQLDEKFSNWIEFCAELDSLVSIMPPGALDNQWVSFLSKTPLGRWKQLKTLLKTLSAGTLFTVFGFLPLVQNAKDISQLATVLHDKLEKISYARIRSGTVKLLPHPTFFRWNIMDYDHLEVVSACDITPNIALGNPAVVMDRLGILPKPSRAWDLLRFSWLADMFFNVQGRLDAVEVILTLYWWGARNFTHSVKLRSSEESFRAACAQAGFRITGGSAFISGYMRETSALVPMVALRTDFWSADTTSRVNWTIVLSLLLVFLL